MIKLHYFVAIVLFLNISHYSWGQTPTAYWTGDGGRGKTVTVSEPIGTGLSAQEQALLPLIQSTIIASFQRFSAMTVFDRQNLENILREQRLSFSGNFSDNDYIRIGNLTNARLVVFGKITKTSNNFMFELAVTDVETGERIASYTPKQVSLLALENLSAIREATADLLGQLGVNLTAIGLQELRKVENTTRVQAENALARGIAAQRQGTVVEALTYYFEAASFDPALREAFNRVSVVSANISNGNLGQDVRNRLQVHDNWRTIVNTANVFYANHLPYEFIYSTNIRRGTIDFERRTTGLAIEVRLLPTDAWKSINDLRKGLRNARQQNETWNFNLDQIEPRQITVTIRILNENNIVLSTASQTFRNPSESGMVNATLNFQNVRADNITDNLIVQVVSINEIPAQKAGETGFVQITTLLEYNRRIAKIQAAETAARREREAVELAKRREIEAAEKEKQENLKKEQEARLNETRLKSGKYRNYVGFGIFNYQWEHSDSSNFAFSGLLYSPSFHWSPLPFTSIGADLMFSLESGGYEHVYFGFSPQIGLIFPIAYPLRIHADALVEMAYTKNWKGTITDFITPGFDVGLIINFLPDYKRTGFINIKYMGLWWDNAYTHRTGFFLGTSWK